MVQNGSDLIPGTPSKALMAWFPFALMRRVEDENDYWLRLICYLLSELHGNLEWTISSEGTGRMTETLQIWKSLKYLHQMTDMPQFQRSLTYSHGGFDLSPHRMLSVNGIEKKKEINRTWLQGKHIL